MSLLQFSLAPCSRPIIRVGRPNITIRTVNSENIEGEGRRMKHRCRCKHSTASHRSSVPGAGGGRGGGLVLLDFSRSYYINLHIVRILNFQYKQNWKLYECDFLNFFLYSRKHFRERVRKGGVGDQEIFPRMNNNSHRSFESV